MNNNNTNQEEKKRKILVLDASVVIPSSEVTLLEGLKVTVPEVRGELKDSTSEMKFSSMMSSGELKEMEPTKESIEFVRRKSIEMGENLGDTDIKLISLAWELKSSGEKVILLTDDYGIQNVASMLDIPWKGVFQPGIREEVKWKWRCPACGKTYNELVRRCEYCGTQVRRTGIGRGRKTT